MKNQQAHLDLYTFRINGDLKKTAHRALGERMSAICRDALVKALEEEKEHRKVQGRVPNFLQRFFVR